MLPQLAVVLAERLTFIQVKLDFLVEIVEHISSLGGYIGLSGEAAELLIRNVEVGDELGDVAISLLCEVKVGCLAGLQIGALCPHFLLRLKVALDLALDAVVGLALGFAEFSLTVSVFLDCLNSLADEFRFLVFVDLVSDVAVTLTGGQITPVSLFLDRSSDGVNTLDH